MIVSFASGPIPPDPSDQPPKDAASCGLQFVGSYKTPEWEEFTFQYPNGELKTRRRWFTPRTNKQRRETDNTLRELAKMPSLESAVHTKEERAHHRRKTRALGKRLRGEAERRKSQRRVETRSCCC